MEDKIVLDSTHYSYLATMNIGKRLRYIRELLRKGFGNRFSGKSLANRVNISQPTLVHLERNANDIPATVLRRICKEMNVPMDVFFDDFYQDDPKSIVIEFDDSIEMSKYVEDSTTKLNPLEEESYKLIIDAYLESSNGDRRLICSQRSKERYMRAYVHHIVTLVIDALDATDTLINPQKHKPYDNKPSSSYLALQLLEISDQHDNYTWVPKQLIIDISKLLESTGRLYTEKLQKEYSNHNGVD